MPCFKKCLVCLSCTDQHNIIYVGNDMLWFSLFTPTPQRKNIYFLKSTYTKSSCTTNTFSDAAYYRKRTQQTFLASLGLF